MIGKTLLKKILTAGVAGIGGYIAGNFAGAALVEKSEDGRIDWKKSGHKPALGAAGVGAVGAYALKKNPMVSAGVAGGALVSAARFEAAMQIVTQSEKEGQRKKSFWDNVLGTELSGDSDDMVQVPRYVLEYAQQKIQQQRMQGNTAPLSGNTAPLSGLPQTIVLAGNNDGEDSVFYTG